MRCIEWYISNANTHIHTEAHMSTHTLSKIGHISVPINCPNTPADRIHQFYLLVALTGQIFSGENSKQTQPMHSIIYQNNSVIKHIFLPPLPKSINVSNLFILHICPNVLRIIWECVVLYFYYFFWSTLSIEMCAEYTYFHPGSMAHTHAHIFNVCADIKQTSYKKTLSQ